MTEVLTGKRVLVLEDEPLIAMVLVDILEEAGCTVVGPAHDAEQAARLIAESSIDVAVLDVNLGSGHTSACIADSLKGAGTPFIFATGYGEMGLRSTDRDTLRVDKPYFAPTILATVAAALKAN
ncbi:MAG TPA: response regulator [Hyphomicrobium sp.]|jgi:CheY-like chemotaxis protein